VGLICGVRVVWWEWRLVWDLGRVLRVVGLLGWFVILRVEILWPLRMHELFLILWLLSMIIVGLVFIPWGFRNTRLAPPMWRLGVPSVFLLWCRVAGWFIWRFLCVNRLTICRK
jgi:hypothetical protein